MTKKSTKQAKQGGSRSPRLSPELDEFLHVMSALENELAPAHGPVATAG